jgi:hypothetical protein
MLVRRPSKSIGLGGEASTSKLSVNTSCVEPLAKNSTLSLAPKPGFHSGGSLIAKK